MVGKLKSILSGFGLTASQKTVVIDKVALRRMKLVNNLIQQKEAAQALLNGKEYYGEKTVWKTKEDGEKIKVKENKRIKHWFYTNDGDNWYFELRYANKSLEVEKGKSAIVVGAKERLIELIDILIDAVKEKEFDGSIAKVVIDRTENKERK